MRNIPWRFGVTVAGVALAATVALSAQARTTAPSPGALMGIVTDAAGYPEAGAVVHVTPANHASSGWQRLTSDHGIFTLPTLAPGTYWVDVGKGNRIAPRQRVLVRASQRSLLLVSLPELASALQFGNAKPANASAAQQLRWALREPPSWRPVFRLQDDPSQSPDTVAQDDADGANVDGYVGMSAGGDTRAFSGNGDFNTSFQINTSLWGQTSMALNGNLDTSGAYPDSQLQAIFQPSSDPDSQSRFLISVRTLATPGLQDLGSLQVITLNYADGLNLGDRLHIQYGGMLTSVNTSSTLRTFNPYMRASYRIGAHGLLEYRYVNAVPPLDFDADWVAMTNPTPQISLDNDRVELEEARHQSVVFTQDLTPNDSISAAAFSEHFEHAGVNGALADATELASGDVLPDLLSNMFTADGGAYGGDGYRLVYQRRLGDDLDAAFSYADGEVLTVGAPRILTSYAAAFRPARASAWTAKIDATVPGLRTHVACSYRALSQPTLTALDPYDDSVAQSEPYANVSLRQPLPSLMGPGNRLEALVEINNLLAQGYIPMVGSDGHTLFLVQSARSVRGGFTINF